MLRAADNPFASHRIERLEYRFENGSWEELIARLEQLRYRACILGSQGSGKTTLLEQLAERLDTRRFRTRLVLHNAQRPAIPWASIASSVQRDIVMIDGADLLSWPQWKLLSLLSLKAGGLVVVSHTRALLPELITCRTTPQLLAQLTSQLVGSQRTQLAATSNVRWQRHAGNVREALRECYELVARQ